MRVEIDDWENCTSDTGIVLDMPLAPIVGDRVHVDEALLPAKYRNKLPRRHGGVEFTVRDRRIEVGPTGVEVHCDVDYPVYFYDPD